MRFAATLLFLLLPSSPAVAYEEPVYEILAEADGYEVRRYAPYVVAELVVEGSFEKAGNRAFRPLAAFISGDNTAAAEIAMTAPVTQRGGGEKIEMTAPVTQSGTDEGAYAIRFVMPARYTLDTVPRPTDARIRLREEPGKVVAVHRYSGTWSEERYRERLARLRDAVARDGLEAAGEPVWSRFDSPFRLWFLRRNEIWLPVEWPGRDPA